MVANFTAAGARLRTWIDRFWGYDVFIAHRRSDGAEYAYRLCEALQAEGIKSFIDREVYGQLRLQTKHAPLRVYPTRQSSKANLSTPQNLRCSRGLERVTMRGRK
jgi:hypothetical protein